MLRVYSAATRLLSAELHAQHGLTLNDYEALQLLSTADGFRLKRVELAKRLLLTPSGVTRLLQGLEEAGLVAKADCPGDLRVTYAELTDAGKAKLDAASCGHVASVCALFEEHLAEDEIEQLGRVLERLPGALADDGLCPGA